MHPSIALAGFSMQAQAQDPAAGTVPVTADNFLRAKSDLYFSNIVEYGGLGRFVRRREPAAIDKKTV